jgi:hypothetical protein
MSAQLKHAPGLVGWQESSAFATDLSTGLTVQSHPNSSDRLVIDVTVTNLDKGKPKTLRFPDE